MSLLLDALRRAEEARRAKEVDENAAPGERTTAEKSAAHSQATGESRRREFAIEAPALVAPEISTSSPPAADNLLPAANSRTDLTLEQFHEPTIEPEIAPARAAGAASARNTLATPPTEIAQRDAARNVFAAKQPGTPLPNEARKRKWILPVVAGAVVIAAGGGWYVWNEVNRVSQPMLARTSAPPVVLPRASPGTGQPGIKPGATAETKTAKVEEAPIPPMLPAPVVALATPRAPVLSRQGAERALTERELLAKNLKEAGVAKDVPPGLKLARSVEPPKLNPELALAYQSLVAGNYGEAQRRYVKLVQAEPLNVDAQLGLATAAARGGDKTLAAQHYRQVLVLDPRNGLALMGLIAINEGPPSAALEIELKTLIGRNPGAAPLHFALGNIYAGEKRWTEAQQAFFEAFRIDPMNPDYLFNLAVSLDQLRQTRLALDYYQKAERMAAANGGGQFDRSTINKRIKELGGDAGRNN